MRERDGFLCFNRVDSLWIKRDFSEWVKQSIFLPVCVTIFLETLSYQVKLDFRRFSDSLIMSYAGSHSEARKLKVFAALISTATVWRPNIGSHFAVGPSRRRNFQQTVRSVGTPGIHLLMQTDRSQAEWSLDVTMPFLSKSLCPSSRHLFDL